MITFDRRKRALHPFGDLATVVSPVGKLVIHDDTGAVLWNSSHAGSVMAGSTPAFPLAYSGAYGTGILLGDLGTLQRAAMAQLSKSQSSLSDYRKAEDIALFWSTAKNTIGARYKAAYWLAVASRLLGGSASLTARSWSLITQANVMPSSFASENVSDVQSIYADAANAVTAAAGGNKQALAVAKILATQSDPGMIAGRQQVTYEQSSRGQVTEAAGASAATAAAGAARVGQDILDVSRWLEERAGGGGHERAWWFWPAVVGGGGLVLVTLLAFFARPYAGIAKEAYGDLKSSVGTLKRANPRKRSRGSTRRTLRLRRVR